MKTIQICSALVTITLFSISCSKVPVAKFEVSNTTPYVDEEITFENTTNSKHTCQWDFGDGTTNTMWSPKHTYNSEGTYTAKLHATNKKGNTTHTKSVTIAVTKSQQQIDAEASSALILQTWSLDSLTLDEINGSTYYSYPTAILWGGTNEYLWIFTSPNILTSYRDGTQETSGTWDFTSGTDLLLDNQVTVDVLELSATKFTYARQGGIDPSYTDTWYFTAQ